MINNKHPGTEPYVLLVSGGRDYRNFRVAYALLDKFLEELPPSYHLVVLQGGARGADNIAREWCEDHGIECITESANWKLHGKAAGPKRNAKMLFDYRVYEGLVFPGGTGTLDMLSRLFRAGIPTRVVGKDGARGYL